MNALLTKNSSSFVRATHVSPKCFYSASLQEALPGLPSLSKNVAHSSPDSTKPNVTKLPNGFTVATTKCFGPASYLSVLVAAGSRYETPELLGASHVLRNMVYSSNAKRSGFRIVREFESLGIYLQATASRQNLVLSAQFFPKSNVSTVLETFSDILTSPVYHPWEIKESKKRVQQESIAAQQNPQTMVVEAAHLAAFRFGLGNSIFAKPHHKIDSDRLHEFSQNRVAASTAILVSSGVQEKEMESLLGSSFSTLASAPSNGVFSSSPAPYFGGELRQESADEKLHLLLGFQGASYADSSSLALGVFQHILGVGKSVQYGKSHGRLESFLSNSKSLQHPAEAQAFNFTYPDAGLFGVYAVCSPCCAETVAKTIQEAVLETASNVKDQEIVRGKQALKLSILTAAETPASYMTDLGCKLLHTGKYRTPLDTCAAIDKLSTAEIRAAMKKAVSSKPTFVVRGDVSVAPYLDALK
eukprot:Sdes_comp20025_c0_seq1m12778